MTKTEILEKLDEAIAVCVDRTKKLADSEQCNGANTLASAAYTLCNMRRDVAATENDA